MRNVKCYECRKRYNYDEDGFCPNCGAFNQPLSPKRIAADGSVIWIEGLNSQNHEGSFLHKEFHEENRKRKGTALEQKPRSPKPVTSRAPAPIKMRPQQQKQGKASVIFVIIVAIIVLNLLRGLIGFMYI